MYEEIEKLLKSAVQNVQGPNIKAAIYNAISLLLTYMHNNHDDLSQYKELVMEMSEKITDITDQKNKKLQTIDRMNNLMETVKEMCVKIENRILYYTQSDGTKIRYVIMGSEPIKR